MNDLTAAAEKVRQMIHTARATGEGFSVVCEALGADPEEISKVVADHAQKLNGDGTLEGAVMNGVLIGLAAERPGGIEWSVIGQTKMHPTQRAILNYLTDHGVGSPNQVSTAIGEPLGDVSYHFRQLLDPRKPEREPSLIELVDTRPVRGSTEHFYRRRPRPLFREPVS